MNTRIRTAALTTTLALGATASGAAWASITEVGPDPGPSPTLGAKPPALDDRTVVLFGGHEFSGWRQRDGADSKWVVQNDGSVLVQGEDAISKATFGDHQIHVEFYLPEMPGTSGQARSNSGVYVHGCIEVQVLDSYGLAPEMNTCGAIYSIAPALVSASRPPNQWQTYDIFFTAAEFDEAGAVTESARMTVLHNGVAIHANREIPHSTPGGIGNTLIPEGPLLLQNHGDPVRYRNVWIRRLD